MTNLDCDVMARMMDQDGDKCFPKAKFRESLMAASKVNERLESLYMAFMAPKAGEQAAARLLERIAP